MQLPVVGQGLLALFGLYLLYALRRIWVDRKFALEAQFLPDIVNGFTIDES